MKIKQAYEIYSLVGGGYNKRHLHGYAWTKDAAQTLANTVSPRRYHIGAVHVIEVNGRWHRIHVIPVEGLIGDFEAALDSRLVEGDIPNRLVPSISFQIDALEPRRLGLDFERAIDTMAGYAHECTCKLYTLRTGGLMPLTFKVRDLLLSEHTQQKVAEWLQYEIEFRKSLPPSSIINVENT